MLIDCVSAAAGIHVGLDALADVPLAKLRKQLDVNLIAQVSVTQVGLTHVLSSLQYHVAFRQPRGVIVSLLVLCPITGSDAMQAFLPLLGTDLTLKGKPGKILNMSSIYGSYTLPFCVSVPLLAVF